MELKPKTRMMLVGVVLPLLIAAAGLIQVLVALPNLPDPAAIHWGPGGEPNNFGSPLGSVLIIGISVLAYCVFAFFVARAGHEGVSVNQRIILAIGPFLSTLLTIIAAGSLVMQVGLEDARQASSVMPLVWIGFGLGLLVGAIAWFLLPKATPTGPSSTADELPTMELGSSARATWSRHAEPAAWVGFVAIGILAIALVFGAVVLWLQAPPVAALVYTVVMLAIAALAVGSLFWRVIIDATGVRVRSVLGIPRFTIPMADVQSANEVTINPITDFGGWGVRWGRKGRIGVITRAGTALEVRRKNGSALVVTVSQARTGAALLNALVARV